MSRAGTCLCMTPCQPTSHSLSACNLHLFPHPGHPWPFVVKVYNVWIRRIIIVIENKILNIRFKEISTKSLQAFQVLRDHFHKFPPTGLYPKELTDSRTRWFDTTWGVAEMCYCYYCYDYNLNYSDNLYDCYYFHYFGCHHTCIGNLILSRNCTKILHGLYI